VESDVLTWLFYLTLKYPNTKLAAEINFYNVKNSVKNLTQFFLRSTQKIGCC